jgi:hypothetical protein
VSGQRHKEKKTTPDSMIHIRIDDEKENSKRKFACGLGPELPPGDIYFFPSELGARKADCPGCNPDGPTLLGVPLSSLSGRPGHPGYGQFVHIADSWGYQ